MKHLKRYIQGLMLVPVLVLLPALASCLDETLVSTTYGGDSGDRDMYIRVNVPRTYATTAAGGATQETLIQNIDVLVFEPGVGSGYGKYFLKSTSEGIPADKNNTFQVLMPVGENLMVHVFTNCHDSIVAKGAYGYREIGMEMEALLSRLTTAKDNNAAGAANLPMHGFLSSVSITKDAANSTLSVPVLRAAAAVQVATNATIDAGGNLTPGEVKDAAGKVIFRLREFYAYFPIRSGRIAPLMDAYAPAGPDDANKTRSVEKVSLPAAADVLPLEKKYSLKSPADVGQLGSLYLYENKHYTDNGNDRPGFVPGIDKVATTRLVVGGVYDGDKTAAGQPKVTYYRVDIADPATGKLADLLRNHKYTFNITNVTGPGYDDPDDAATGVPINITIQVIDWTDVNNNVDFDRENWFSTGTKNIVLPRDVNSVCSTGVESDVAFGSFWTLGFETDKNGAAAPVKVTDGAATATIENDRYKVTVDRTATAPHTKATLSVTAKQAYANAPVPPASRDEVLVIQVKNLKVRINITQEDKSPDDWGNGGDHGADVGENGIHLSYEEIDMGGAACTHDDKLLLSSLIFAPGNLRQQNNDGTGPVIMAGPTEYGHYYTWRSTYTGNTSQNGVDPCTRLDASVYGANWRTPNNTVLAALTRCTNKVLTNRGMWFMNNRIGLFLPAAGFRGSSGGSGTSASNNPGMVGRYWSSDYRGPNGFRLAFNNNNTNIDYYNSAHGFSVRCVKDAHP